MSTAETWKHRVMSSVDFAVYVCVSPLFGKATPATGMRSRVEQLDCAVWAWV